MHKISGFLSKNAHLCEDIPITRHLYAEMISRRSRILSAVVICLISIFSCKKDEEETQTLPSLDGVLSFNGEDYEFIKVNSAAITFTPSGVSHPEDGNIEYIWTVSHGQETPDTSKAENGAFTFTFPDSLGTYSVVCTARAEGYYSKSVSYNITTVGEKSLEGMGFSDGDEIFTDARDNKDYHVATIGNLVWFRQNLAYAEAGSPYRDAEAMSDIFGRYYTWDELDGLCPEGWRVPAEKDWTDLAKSLAEDASEMNELEKFEGIAGKMMANARFNTELLWEFWPAVDIDNGTGLAMIPTGFANISGDSKTFLGVNKYAAFWTATENADNKEQAYYRYIIDEAADVMLGHGYKNSFAANVRCVKDK